MTHSGLRGAAKAHISEEYGYPEGSVRIVEMQKRQGEVCAKYVVEGLPSERYDILPQEVVDGAE